jgi:hypothetical protein
MMHGNRGVMQLSGQAQMQAQQSSPSGVTQGNG